MKNLYTIIESDDQLKKLFNTNPSLLSLFSTIFEKIALIESNKTTTKDSAIIERVCLWVNRLESGDILSTVLLAKELNLEARQVGRALQELKRRGVLELIAINHYRKI